MAIITLNEHSLSLLTTTMRTHPFIELTPFQCNLLKVDFSSEGSTYPKTGQTVVVHYTGKR